MQAASERFLPFEEARAMMRKQGLTSKKQWQEWSRPANIPSHPEQVYKMDGFISWPDWLGPSWEVPLGSGEGKPLLGMFPESEEARQDKWEVGLLENCLRMPSEDKPSEDK